MHVPKLDTKEEVGKIFNFKVKEMELQPQLKKSWAPYP